MERYLCLHGHFYQPPRENPWLEAVELQDSAFPFHDWNARVTAECYAPNAASRVLDANQKILEIVNNYSRISFNFGPTLLRWLETGAPRVYESILKADQDSRERFSNHGNAMAQAYHHSILPLSNRRDKVTEVNWGIRDFEHRFGRFPEGMWLPETAVDLDTLEVLSELGIRFTVLSPYQAHRVRKVDEEKWKDVSGGNVDPQRSYRIELPSGRNMALFFYDGPISRAVAFEQLLVRGENFAGRLTGAFPESSSSPRLVHIATDGETYGHHHRHGEMALAYALNYIETNQLARLTNYGEYLEKHPPEYEVQIHEETSWSCAHGVERWRSDCGCHTGGEAGWDQAWRKPLREALEWLREELIPLYENEAGKFLKDPWAARDHYIDVIVDRSPESLNKFFNEQATKSLERTERFTALKLLELQRHALLMFTSCGWFFNELSGIETVQVIQYAGRALQLASDLFENDLESGFLERLSRAQSNIPEHQNGQIIFEKFVRPTRVELTDVAAHYAISSLFEQYGDETEIYCYKIDQQVYKSNEAGRARVVVGQCEVTSEITLDSADFSFGVLHFGDHNLTCGVRTFQDQETYLAMSREVREAFKRADIPQTLRLLDAHFQNHTYSLRSLFRDERRKVLDRILETNISETEMQYRQIYNRQGSLMQFLADMQSPPPRSFQMAAEFVMNSRLRESFKEIPLDLTQITELVQEAQSRNIKFEKESLSYEYTKVLERLSERFHDEPSNFGNLEQLHQAVNLNSVLPFSANLWTIQNLYYDVLLTILPQYLDRKDEPAVEWVREFKQLGKALHVRVE